MKQVFRRCDGRPLAASTGHYASCPPQPPYVIWHPVADGAGAGVVATVHRPRRPAGRPPCPGALSYAGSDGAVPENFRRTPDTGACPCPDAFLRPGHCLHHLHRHLRWHCCHRPCGVTAYDKPSRRSCES